ncbi:MAG: hypothetical protein K8R40_01430, partial [Anaerolineaceae bacterium]|nr:hypothetical protein [Anaerolineaceae bacterium]
GLHSFAQDTFPILVFGALALFETDIFTSQRERMMFKEYFSTLHQYSQERTMILSVKPALRLQTPPWNRLLQSATHIYDLRIKETAPTTQPDLFGGSRG